MSEINDWQEVPIDDWQEVPVGGTTKNENIGFPIPPIGPRVNPGVVSTGLSRGVAGTLGMPVDAVTPLFNLAGANIQKPVMGSQWIEEALNPYPTKPQGIGETLIQSGAEAAPQMFGTGIYSALKKGVGLAQEIPNILKLLSGSAAGETAARTIAPDNPVASMVGQILGTAGAGWGTIARPRSAADAERIIDTVIDRGIQQGVKPLTRAGGQRAWSFDQMKQNGRTLVKDIVENKDANTLTDAEGAVVGNKVPYNAPQMLEALQQSEMRNFKAYAAEVEKATGTKQKYDLGDTIQALATFAKNEVNQVVNKDAVRYARNRIEDFIIRDADGNFVGIRQFSPQQFEEALQGMATTRKKMMTNPSRDINKMQVDAIIEKSMWEKQNSIMDAASDTYRPLKDKYAAARALEADVTQRARVTTRQGNYSLIDFSDVYTLPQIFGNLAVGNIPGAAKGAMAKGIAKYIKYANSPDTAIKNMFQTVEKLAPELPKQSTSKWTPELEGPSWYHPEYGQTVGQPYGAPNVPVPTGGPSYALAQRGQTMPVPVGTPYGREITVTSTGQVMNVPTGATPMPSNAEMLLRHPMGERGLVPTGAHGLSQPIIDPYQMLQGKQVGTTLSKDEIEELARRLREMR